MGVIINTDNNYLTTFLDILIVFCLGSVLLFFANAMKNENRFVMLYVTILVIIMVIYNMIYLHSNVDKEEKKTNNYNILTFMNIYMIILMVLLSSMSYYIISGVENAKND